MDGKYAGAARDSRGIYAGAYEGRAWHLRRYAGRFWDRDRRARADKLRGPADHTDVRLADQLSYVRPVQLRAQRAVIPGRWEFELRLPREDAARRAHRIGCDGRAERHDQSLPHR